MTVLHLKSGADCKVHLGDMDVGVANADVQVTIDVKKAADAADVIWKAEMRQLLDDLGEVHLQEYPQSLVRDPWTEE